MQENVFFFLKAKNSVKYLYDNISVEDGLALMRKHKYTAMPIINKEGVYVGTITEGDFLWYLLDHPSIHKEDLEQMEIRELIRGDFTPPVQIDVPVDQLFAQSLNTCNNKTAGFILVVFFITLKKAFKLCMIMGINEGVIVS